MTRSQTPEERELIQPRILIVDDDEDIVSACREFFSNEGYETHSVYLSEEALDFLSKKSVDVVITGINQPNMSGLELTKIIKENYDIDVIIFTGYKQDGLYEKARSVGASDFFYKPVKLVDLLNSVKKVLKRRHLASNP
jgi:two-component system cell cycle response regulator